MKPDIPLLLDLDQQNLAHFLSALALASLADRIEGVGQQARTCWWKDDGHFAIQSEYSGEDFRLLLYSKAHEFLKALKWVPGLGGVAQGVLVSGREVGINPFIYLGGDSRRPPLRAFSAKVVPAKVLPQQVEKLRSPANDAWLNEIERGVSSWGFDCRVNMDASDAGISSDAEGTGGSDPIFPAIELLSLAAVGFFVSASAWQTGERSLCAAAWTYPIPLQMALLASTGRIHGLPARRWNFASRGRAHGEGRRFQFFPPATSRYPGDISL
ncbi:MAG TPA: hypothetical protein VHZ07_26430 [Bryobacteraceae bacterium]|nr:hypothetical protein [Bryobacteraceae bacterium]